MVEQSGQCARVRHKTRPHVVEQSGQCARVRHKTRPHVVEQSGQCALIATYVGEGVVEQRRVERLFGAPRVAEHHGDLVAPQRGVGGVDVGDVAEQEVLVDVREQALVLQVRQARQKQLQWLDIHRY